MLIENVKKEDISINDTDIYIKGVSIKGFNKVNIYKEESLLYRWYRVEENEYRQQDGSYVIPNKELKKDIQGELYIDNCQPIEVNLIEFMDISIKNRPLIETIRVAINDKPILYFSPIYKMEVISENRILINDIYIDIKEILGIKVNLSFSEATLSIWMKKGVPIINQWLDKGVTSGLNKILDDMINLYNDEEYTVKVYYYDQS